MDLRLLTSIGAQGAGQAGAVRGAQSAVGAAAAGAKGGAATRTSPAPSKARSSR